MFAVLQQLGQIYIKVHEPFKAIKVLRRALNLSEHLFEKTDINYVAAAVPLAKAVLMLSKTKKLRIEGAYRVCGQTKMD